MRTPRILAPAALVLLAACGSSAPAPHHAKPSPAFTALTLPAACKLLRADILANGGTPDAATLQRIIGHSTDGHLISDAQGALKDLGKADNGIVMGLDLGFMDGDCHSTGVTIPSGTG